jgi:phosphatidylglycerophosphatase C
MTETADGSGGAATSHRPVVAAFDVDGTLTHRDCVAPFLRRVGGVRSLVLAFARRPLATVRAGLRRDRDRLKEVFVGGVLQRRSVADVAEIGRAFAREVERSQLRADTVARLRWHQQMGHRTVLVSASLRMYLDPLATALGVEHVVCTDVVADAGRYTRVLKGRNCRAAEKVTRLDALLAAHAMADAEIWAYGDSAGDRQLLARADHPVWVRGATLRAVPDGLAT